MTVFPGRFDGQVALVTGAAQGQGEAEARRLVAEGASVVVADVLDEQGRAVADELGDAAVFVHLDVADADQWPGAVDAALDRFGRIDVLVNNAGIGVVAPLDEIDLAVHQRLLDVNLTGVFLGMRAVKAPMAAAGGGAIVNISSIDGLVGVRRDDELRRHQVRGDGDDPLGRPGAGTARDPGELGPSRRDRQPHGERGAGTGPGAARPPHGHAADRPDGRARGGRRPGALPRQPEASYVTGAQFVVDGGHIAGPWREEA